MWPDDDEDAETGSDEADVFQLHCVSPTMEATLVEIFSEPLQVPPDNGGAEPTGCRQGTALSALEDAGPQGGKREKMQTKTSVTSRPCYWIPWGCSQAFSRYDRLNGSRHRQLLRPLPRRSGS